MTADICFIIFCKQLKRVICLSDGTSTWYVMCSFNWVEFVSDPGNFGESYLPREAEKSNQFSSGINLLIRNVIW